MSENKTIMYAVVGIILAVVVYFIYKKSIAAVNPAAAAAANTSTTQPAVPVNSATLDVGGLQVSQVNSTGSVAATGNIVGLSLPTSSISPAAQTVVPSGVLQGNASTVTPTVVSQTGQLVAAYNATAPASSQLTQVGTGVNGSPVYVASSVTPAQPLVSVITGYSSLNGVYFPYYSMIPADQVASTQTPAYQAALLATIPPGAKIVANIEEAATYFTPPPGLIISG